MSFEDIHFDRVYESSFDGDQSLIDNFYRPFLSECEYYGRLAGYFSLKGLALSLRGIDELYDEDTKIRVIAGADLNQNEKELLYGIDEPQPPWVRSQLAIIGDMLDSGDLEIKIADPQSGGIFHPKMGVGEDVDGNVVSFEGSINETMSAWKYNFERFKVHRSWIDGEYEYTELDVDTFKSLWRGEYGDVDVRSIPDADAQNIIDWKDYTIDRSVSVDQRESADDKSDVDSADKFDSGEVNGDQSDSDIDHHIQFIRENDPEKSVDITESTVAGVLDNLDSVSGSLWFGDMFASIDPWEHQQVITNTAVSVYPQNLLFADEVGLGKTIEVGVTVSRLIQSGECSSALFLVPASLVSQWQDELLNRCNIHAYTHEKASDGSESLVGPYGHRIDLPPAVATGDVSIGSYVRDEVDRTVVVLKSWHTARLDGNIPSVASPSSFDGADKSEWDVAVVDEAHNARKETNLYDLLTAVNESTQCMYLLTATPMQLEVSELYDLLRLCDLPSGWNDRDSFEEFFRIRGVLQSLFEEYSPGEVDMDLIQRELRAELELEDTSYANQKVSEHVDSFIQLNGSLFHWSESHAQAVETAFKSYCKGNNAPISDFNTLYQGLLNTALNADIPETDEILNEDSWPYFVHFLVEISSWATPVRSLMFRNGREIPQVKEDVADRHPERVEISLDGDVKTLYDDIETYIEEMYAESENVLSSGNQKSIGFAMTVYKKRMTSSLNAISESLKRRRESLLEKSSSQMDISQYITEKDASESLTESDIDNLAGDENVVDSVFAERMIESELEYLDDYYNDLGDITDPKLEQLGSDLGEFEDKGIDSVVIFTQYTDTLEYIKQTLTPRFNVGTYTGDGCEICDTDDGSFETVGKERVANAFAAGEIQKLICTDSASEGLNLQTADALINYDLPWNPMLVEQRIGRIDRIGQSNDDIEILNYAYEDSIDQQIYQTLNERVDIFKGVVGELRPILKDIEQEINAESSPEDVVDVIDTVEKQSEDVKSKHENVGIATTNENSKTNTYQTDITFERRRKNENPVSHEYGLQLVDSSLNGEIESVDQSNETVDITTSPDGKTELSITTELIKTAIIESESIESRGWTFSGIRSLTQSESNEQYDDLKFDVYVLSPPKTKMVNETHPAFQESTPGQTAQEELSETDSGEILITFNPSVKDTYPSVRLLLPGDPLYHHFIDILFESGWVWGGTSNLQGFV